MEAPRPALLLWLTLLAVAAIRTLLDGAAASCGLCAAGSGPPVIVPRLAQDGAERLAWLPGVGAGRAARIVRARPMLGTALTPPLLAHVPGLGAVAARETAAALLRWESWRSAQGSALLPLR